MDSGMIVRARDGKTVDSLAELEELASLVSEYRHALTLIEGLSSPVGYDYGNKDINDICKEALKGRENDRRKIYLQGTYWQ